MFIIIINNKIIIYNFIPKVAQKYEINYLK
jgi:hypothetical protein